MNEAELSSCELVTTRSRTGLRQHRLLINSLLLAVVLFGLLPVLNNGYPAMVDESVYSTQAANLADGSWKSERPLPEIDTDGWHSPLIDATIIGDEWIPYARQPLYPLAVAPLFGLGGYTAMLVFSVVGTWSAAMAGSAIAHGINRRATIPTLWVAGLGTPLLFDAYIAVAHSWAAAMSGICALAVLRSSVSNSLSTATRKSRFWWAVVAASSAAVLVLLRSEGALVAGAIATTGSLLALNQFRTDRSIPWSRLATPVIVGLAGIAAYIGNGQWVSRITGGPSLLGGEVPRVTDPLRQAWASLIRPWGLDTRNASAAMALSVGCLVLAAIALRVTPRRPLVGCALLSLGAAASLARHFERIDQVSGLLATAPILTFGILLIGRSELSSSAIRFLLGTSGLTAVGVLWFAYGEGGAAEWGGRFYHVLIPLLTPVAVVAALRLLGRLPVGYSRVVVAGILVITISVATLSLRHIADNRRLSRNIVREAVALSSKLGDDPLVAVATVNPTGLSRLFWAEVRDGYPILNGGNLATFTELLPRASRSDHEEFLLITDTNPTNVQYVVNKVLKRLQVNEAWSVEDARPLGDTGYAAITLRKVP